MDKLIIIRSLPGGGKSFLANELRNSSIDPYNCSVHETDEKFMRYEAQDDGPDRWIYRFDPSKLGEYHQQNLTDAIHSMASGCPLVIVPNTNTTFMEMRPYIIAAHLLKYEVEIMEPSTEWRYDAQLCFAKNTHSVPLESIQRMRARWESTETCLAKMNNLIKTLQEFS